MKSIQLIKQVNNTELGKGGTHETYILIPQDLDVSDLFLETDKEYVFTDKDSGKVYVIRLTSAREKRIVGMGPYYRDNNVMAGDQILLEKRIYDNGLFDFFKQSGRYCVFSKSQKLLRSVNSREGYELARKTISHACRRNRNG